MADDADRARINFEARCHADEKRITMLEKQLSEAQMIAEVADKRYDEV